MLVSFIWISEAIRTLTRRTENVTPRAPQIEQKAAELAYFLRVPIEVF